MVFFAVQNVSQKIAINDTIVAYDTELFSDENVTLNANGSITFNGKGIFNVDVNLSVQLGSSESMIIKARLNGVAIQGGGLNINTGPTVSTANRASNFVVKACRGDILTITGNSTFGDQANLNNNFGTQSSIRIFKS